MTVRDIIMSASGAGGLEKYGSNNVLMYSSTTTNAYIGRSSNGGATWTAMYDVPWEGGDMYGYTSVDNYWLLPIYYLGRMKVPLNGALQQLIAGANSPTDLLAIPGTSIVLGFGFGTGGVQRSVDGGVTFTNVLTPTSGNGTFVSCAVYGGGAVFYSTVDVNSAPRQQYHYRSTDNGLTWSSITSGLPSESAGSYGGGYSLYAYDTFWVYLPSATVSGALELYISYDNALTWAYVQLQPVSGPPFPDQNPYGDVGSAPFLHEGFFWTYNTFNPGLFQANDLPRSWTLYRSPPAGMSIISLAPIPGGVLALCADTTNYNGTHVYQLLFGGNWVYLSNPKPANYGYITTTKTLISLNTPGK